MPLSAVLAPEDEVAGAGHVGGGHEGADDTNHEKERIAAAAGAEEDLVLGPEPCEREDPRQRERSDDEGPEGGGHVLPQPTHVAHVVGVHGMDEGAGPEEQKRLEEGVGEEVEN